jgi:signal transduction histidine kinase
MKDLLNSDRNNSKTKTMQKLWNYISNLGVKDDDSELTRRTIILSNQLNFVMLVSMLLLLAITVPLMLLTNDPISYGTLRVVILLGFNFLNLVVAGFGFTRLSKFFLIYIPPAVFLLGPTLFGYVEEESYTYYPYVLICASIIPQLLLHPRDEKLLFWLSMTYYFVLVIFIDLLMVHFGTSQFPIVERINTFYPFYKIAQIILFMFINACIYYLRMLNFRFEEQLHRKNRELDIQNLELTNQKNEIERQKDELVRKETSTWQKLVSIISHEIVNSAIPITNLAGMSIQMLEDESGAVMKPQKIGDEAVEDIHHGLKIIESRTKALINFVKSTKSLTQIPKPVIRQIRIKELSDRITFLFQSRFKEMGIHFEKQIKPPDLVIEADLELIETVIINLIQNAIEAMEGIPHPRLSFNAEKSEPDQIQISLSDNGKGIDEDVMERIFLPFYSTKPNNSGIGLSLSQQIMMLHNARLEVNSEPGKGATFTMIFPIFNNSMII